MITSKAEYYRFLQEDKKANGFSGRAPHLISIWEKDVIWKYLRILRTSEYLNHIVSTGGKHVFSISYINYTSIGFFEVRLRRE